MSDANTTKFEWEIRGVKALERIAAALEAANDIARGHAPQNRVNVDTVRRIARSLGGTR